MTAVHSALVECDMVSEVGACCSCLLCSDTPLKQEAMVLLLYSCGKAGKEVALLTKRD